MMTPRLSASMTASTIVLRLNEPDMRKTSISDMSRFMKFAVVFALLSGLVVSHARAAWERIERDTAPIPVQAGAQEEFFEKKIRPIFAASCQRCHNSRLKVAGF